ncbi:4530_t:CDS:2 [Rhizophagus irregularis]|nr:4530_t:CDS:2 [Rhizophagus irregularis]
MNQSHISNFTETIERTPSFYASLIIRRRNDRRERHKIKIDTTRVGRLPLQNTNNQSSFNKWKSANYMSLVNLDIDVHSVFMVPKSKNRFGNDRHTTLTDFKLAAVAAVML